jgi:hypothetical protein
MPPASLNGTPLCRLESTCFTMESTHDLLARLLVPVVNHNIWILWKWERSHVREWWYTCSRLVSSILFNSTNMLFRRGWIRIKAEVAFTPWHQQFPLRVTNLDLICTFILLEPIRVDVVVDWEGSHGAVLVIFLRKILEEVDIGVPVVSVISSFLSCEITNYWISFKVVDVVYF